MGALQQVAWMTLNCLLKLCWLPWASHWWIFWFHKDHVWYFSSGQFVRGGVVWVAICGDYSNGHFTRGDSLRLHSAVEHPLLQDEGGTKKRNSRCTLPQKRTDGWTLFEHQSTSISSLEILTPKSSLCSVHARCAKKLSWFILSLMIVIVVGGWV